MRVFHPDHILHDRYLQEYTPFDTQGFLEKMNSELADLIIEEKPVAVLLDQVAEREKLDVRVLLVKLQVERGLVTGPVYPEDLEWAMGYGVDDYEYDFSSFVTQVELAARALTGYLKEDHPFSVVGKVGKYMNLEDGHVQPENLATAALYRYTPWIGTNADDFPGAHEELTEVQEDYFRFANHLFHEVWWDFFGFDPRQYDGQNDKKTWKIISPPDNWKNPILVGEQGLAALEEVSRRLGLVTRRDEQRAKFYVGLPRPKTPDFPDFSSGDVVVYPSGRVFHVMEPSWAEEVTYAPAVPGAAAPLIAADEDAPLSEHFKLSEFQPRDPQYRYLRVSPELIKILEQIRAAVGHPLLVNSGYRPKKYNAGVGGAPLSTHIDGLAADISCLLIPVSTLYEKADALVGDRGGVGYYPSQEFVHVDVRGERVRWVS